MIAASRASVLLRRHADRQSAHGQPRQIGDQDAFVAGDCHRQRADGGGLIDDETRVGRVP